jgi:pseudaminic acid biosynthesis-associated methylase
VRPEPLRAETSGPGPERQRLEALWAGEFGDAYVDRNIDAASGRVGFWRALVEQRSVASALEVGCNVGGNLMPLAQVLGTDRVSGIDLNEKALALLRERVPGIDVRLAPAAELPFPDRSFDLVLTMGVLIHQPDDSLHQVMREVMRCSSRLVFCCEYHSPEPVEVSYRGQRGALFKRPYGEIYRELFPVLTLLEQGKLRRDEGWDDASWWLFERRG